jgi:styrene-oxide isomerase
MTDAEPTPLAARHRSLLALHGAAGVLVGLLGGLAFLFNILRFIEIFPFGPRIQKQVPGTEAAWRAAHTGPIMNGMLAIGVSASGSMIELTPRAQRGLVAAMIVTLWGNVVGYNAAAIGGQRGLTPGGDRLNNVAYFSFLAAAISALVAVPLMIIGLRRHRRDEAAPSERDAAHD